MDKAWLVPPIVTGELSTETHPGQIWQIDYIGPLPMSRRYKHICTCVDTYSGVLVACAYSDATQRKTIRTLDIITFYYETPL